MALADGTLAIFHRGEGEAWQQWAGGRHLMVLAGMNYTHCEQMWNLARPKQVWSALQMASGT